MKIELSENQTKLLLFILLNPEIYSKEAPYYASEYKEDLCKIEEILKSTISND